MNILNRIIRRLCAECTWAKMGVYSQLVYYKSKPILECNVSYIGGQNTEFCDLAVVTFNNSEVVEYQIRTLKKFFKYPFRYTVFDNSTKKSVSKEIYTIIPATIANKSPTNICGKNNCNNSNPIIAPSGSEIPYKNAYNIAVCFLWVT